MTSLPLHLVLLLLCLLPPASQAEDVNLQAAVGCPTVPTTPEDRRTDKTRLRIATYNVEWLFLNRANCPGTGCKWATKAAAQNHLESIAGVLRRLNADVVVLPEVEDCTVLGGLSGLLSDMKYRHYLVLGTDSATGQNVGLLTRVDPSSNLRRTEARHSYPVAGSQCGFTGTGDSGVSKHFYTTLPAKLLDATSPPILLIGVHFIAFPTTDDRCAQREAQAKVIRDLVQTEGLAKGYEVVVLGDVNDYERSFTDAAASVPTSKVLEIIKGTELDHFKVKLESGVTASQTYSSWYDRNSNCVDDGGDEHTVIDHILFSKSRIKSKVRFARFDQSYTASCSSLNSDHWPVWIELTTSGVGIHTPQTHSPGTTTPLVDGEQGNDNHPRIMSVQTTIALSFAVGSLLVLTLVFLLQVLLKKIHESRRVYVST